MYVSLILSIHFFDLAKVSLECWRNLIYRKKVSMILINFKYSNLFSASENREAIHKIALWPLTTTAPYVFYLRHFSLSIMVRKFLYSVKYKIVV